MRRRTFVAGMAAVMAAPVVAETQSAKVYRVAIVYPAGTVETIAEPILMSELRRLGYVEGTNLLVDRRSGGGQRERYREVAREVVAFKPDVIFAPSGRMAEACRAITSLIPIITITSDPVSLGLATSLARPGGNITGFTVDAGVEVVSKRVELLKEATPTATRVAFLATEQAVNGHWGSVIREAVQRAGAVSIAATLSNPIQESAYRRAFSVMATERAQALVVTDHAEGFANRKLIVELAASGRLPAIYPYREFIDAGGLMAYAFDNAETRRLVARYVDRILKGANPAELPFQQPSKFDLTINLKTAKTLGLTIPRSLLLRADQVIE